ncbi:MAG: tRNA (N6-threonylcarbamoyladenosine(37)-N6)-methyltransferase TrmO [Lachnospiraceae bacterium]|nr:tRNA (N6-threonylcarbamoyladenosine(37)-N6)-methyltransferase TrmO [Lachnospiraceae bacterium]
MKNIAKIETYFPTKFGIPRQSGLIESLRGRILFEPEYRNPDALKGLEGFSHLWLLWGFSEIKDKNTFHATARPPRLGGNQKMGIFATRSPFHPNSIGLSCVKLDKIEYGTEWGAIIHVLGTDMVSGTPIYDIKPYIPYTDCKANATGGFTDSCAMKKLSVILPQKFQGILAPEIESALCDVLAEDPRPAVQRDNPQRIYGFPFAGWEIRFSVTGDTLTVVEIKAIV